MQKSVIRNKELYLATLFVVLCFLLYLTWSLMQPFDSGPDEYMRYDIPKYIFKNWVLPLGQDPSLRNPIWGISYGFEPVLPSIISSIFMKIVRFFSIDEFSLLMAARMVSVLASVGTVITVIKISKRLFNKQMSWIFVSMVSFLPQFVFVSTYVNNDSLAIFSGALIVYFWVTGQESHWSIKDCIGLGIGISICALSYFNAYGFILMSIIFYLWSSIGYDHSDSKTILKKASIIAGIVFVLAGWWFIRNIVVYGDGDLFALKASKYYAQLYAIDKYKPSNRETPFNLGHSLQYMLFQMNWLKNSYVSFIGKFGYMSIPLKQWMYWVYSLIFFFGLTGLFLRIKDIKKNFISTYNSQKTALYVCLFVSALIPIILAIYYSYCSDFQPQGRYWLPGLIPLMLFIGMGIEEFSSLFRRFKGNFLYLIFLTIFFITFASCFQLIPLNYF